MSYGKVRPVIDQPALESRVFVSGPAVAGKTSFALQHMAALIEMGINPASILVLVPQRSIGQIYQASARDLEPYRGEITMVTLSGLARRNLERFWPLVAGAAGYDHRREPVFLTIETAQYYMMRSVRPAVAQGIFDSIGLAPPRIAAQLLDNMAKAAIAGFSFEQIGPRLVAGWGDRHSSRVRVYNACQSITDDFLAYCRQNNLLDYAAQLKVFTEYLVPHPAFEHYFVSRYQHLIADNIEESGPLAHDFIAHWWQYWQSAVLVMDTEAGYRTFLGASPENAEGLAKLCETHLVFEQRLADSNESLYALEQEIQRALNPVFSAPIAPKQNPKDALSYETQSYFPQMVSWVTDRIAELVQSGVSPGQIVVLSPYLSDSLRFSIQTRLERAGIPAVSHRPSRALRDEPAARVMFTLLTLAFPHWGFPAPPRQDIVDVFIATIQGLDPLRARLLADIVYKPNLGGVFSSFEQIHPAMRDRITYTVGERFERFRQWMDVAIAQHADHPVPPDYFMSRLFGELLSQPGYGFHADLEAGRIVAQLVESARKFRQVLYPHQFANPDWNAVGHEYLQLVNEGVLSAQYLSSWSDENLDAVLLAPAFTFLMRNRSVDYQFWLDIGSDNWWKRLDQPLTHPYVLTRHYPQSHIWTEQDEEEKQREVLHRLMVGLVRRCHKHIFLGVSDLGEQGFEQRGPMLYVLQQMLQRYGGEYSA